MREYIGRVVRSTAGREKGEVFWVVGAEEERLLLADGKRRKLARPKRKKPIHVELLTDRDHGYDHPTMEKLKQGQALTDKELRRALAAFRAKEV